MSDELIRREVAGELTVEQLASQMEKLRDVMRKVMKEGEDYGVIPGTGGNKKPLLQPGAEKLAMLFRMAPSYLIAQNDLPGGHREFTVTCKLTHIPTGNFCGEATASCSSMEPKYRYRGGSISCPTCGKSAIIKGKAEYGGGWVCFKRKGGCGAKFPENQFSEGQIEKQENPDIATEFNTIVQMAQKRSFIRAIRQATASSELFTQDVDEPDPHRGEESQEPHDDARRPAPQQTQTTTTPPASKPKPQLSEEFTKLRDSLYKMMKMEPGNAIKAHADAVVGFVCEGVTLNDCAKDDAVVKKVMDELIARNAVGTPVEEIYRDALVKFNIALPQWLADAMQPVVS